MRRLTVTILFLAFLSAATFFLWQHRFQRVANGATASLGEVARSEILVPGATREQAEEKLSLKLTVDNEISRVVQRLPLKPIGAVDFLMVDFQVKAVDVVPSSLPWEDGRLIIEWHGEDGRMDSDYLASLRGTETSRRTTLVSRPLWKPAVPFLRVEHLGRSGSFRVVRCDLVTVEETLLWRLGRWLLFFGWFGWCAALICRGYTSGCVQPLLAAAIWILVASQVILPGPWRSYRPLLAPFAVGSPTAKAPMPSPTPTPIVPGPAVPVVPEKVASVPSLGRLPPEPNLMLRIKNGIKNIRPLLHIMLFFGPALAFLILVGRKRAAVLCGLLAAGAELAQFLFGYGWDWQDVGDLTFDAAGVGLAFLAYRQMAQWPLIVHFITFMGRRNLTQALLSYLPTCLIYPSSRRATPSKEGSGGAGRRSP